MLIKRRADPIGAPFQSSYRSPKSKSGTICPISSHIKNTKSTSNHNLQIYNTFLKLHILNYAWH